MTLKEIEQLAETQWEGCHGCDENDKYFWISGFVQGYLSTKIDNVDDRIEANRGKIADLLINGLDCHYSGLPSPKAYNYETWDDIEEEYMKDEYPVFGGPFTDALKPFEWLKKYYYSPKRK